MKRRPLEEVLAERLRALTSEQKLPLSHLADRAGVARSYLWLLLDAKSSATLDVIQRLASVLEVEPVALLVPPPQFPLARPVGTPAGQPAALPNPLPLKKRTKKRGG